MDISHPNFTDRKKQLKIKVCGMREPQNIEKVSQLRVDMIGFIFYEKSPRFVSLEDIPNFNELESVNLQKVGVFVNAKTPEVLEKVGDFQLEYVQLHGDESPEYCSHLKSIWPSIKIIKAFSVNEDFDFDFTKEYEEVCDMFLFDTKGENRGGNGITFDWDLLNNYKGNTPFLLSGGIGEEHADVVSKMYFPEMVGIDLNSRFEIEPALKDIEKLKRFISKIKEQ